MIAADIFRPGQWTNFFLLVGTGAVTLTGLVFVAMSLNLKVIAIDATHRNRAINTLTGLALVFMRCALVLMGAQNHHSIGSELLVVCSISAAVFVNGYIKAIRTSNGLRLSRIVGGSFLHLAEMVGATIDYGSLVTSHRRFRAKRLSSYSSRYMPRPRRRWHRRGPSTGGIRSRYPWQPGCRPDRRA
jgi:hypothetical protein